MDTDLVFLAMKAESNEQRRYVGENGSAAILATKKSAGVASEVSLREHVTYTPPPNVNKAAHSDFETQWRCHQKSKKGVSVASQKRLMSPKKILIK